MLFSWPAIISVTLEYSVDEVLLVTPDCSSGRKLLVISNVSSCFWTLSWVFRALSTLAWVVGSRSGISIANPSLGFLSLSEMEILHSTVLLDVVDVVSAMRVPTDALVLYVASMSRSESITSPLNLMELPSSILKSLLAMPNATKWKIPSLMS